MGRRAKPYKKAGWYCTSVGGEQHQKLCRISEGMPEAELALARLLIKQDEMPRSLVKNAIPTVAEAHDSFLDFCLVEKSLGTYNFYQKNLIFFYDMFALRKIKDLTSDDGVAYKKSLVAAKYSNNTINARLQTAKRLLNWVIKPSRRQQYLCTVNPFEELRNVPATNRERTITDAEYDIILKQMLKYGERMIKGGTKDSIEMFGLMRRSTMRPQEIRHLRWEYIQWDKHRIVFPAEFVKTRRRREVTLLDLAEGILRGRAERLKLCGNDVSRGYVFFSPKRSKVSGKRRDANVYTDIQLNSNQLSCRWRLAVVACVKRGEIEDRTHEGMLVPYSFRHTRITEMVKDGHSIPVIMTDAGHANPTTTMRYVHLVGSEVTEQIRQVDRQKRVSSVDDAKQESEKTS